MRLNSRVYATTMDGHRPIAEMLEQALLSSAPMLETGAALYEQRQSDGSFHLAVVGSAIQHCRVALTALGLRLVREGQFDGVAWDSLVVGA